MLFRSGHRLAAVNLSDLAAMGALPRFATLALTMPQLNEPWLAAFAAGLGRTLQAAGVSLIGGDTTRGPLTLTLQLLGFVNGAPLTRRGARCGDVIAVSGSLGDARAGLDRALAVPLAADDDALLARFLWPTPRLALGSALRSLASAAIDVSDGLVADLGHILEMSQVGAQINLDQIPVSPVCRAHIHETGWDMVLANGDDYELCFTVPEKNIAALEKLEPACGFHRIGVIESEPGLRIIDEAGKPYQSQETGHEHFT